MTILIFNDSETWIMILQIDPLLPITPARPRPKKAGLATPLPQISQSKNRRAAMVLFTPRKEAQAHATQPQPSPTPQPSLQTHGSFPISIGSTSSIEQEMEHLDLGSSESESESSSEDTQAQEHDKTKKKKKKGRGVAEDVWKFFEKDMGGKQSLCKFCM